MRLARQALVVAGLLQKPSILWPLVTLGSVGMIGFGFGAWMVISTISQRMDWFGWITLQSRLLCYSMPMDRSKLTVASRINFREDFVITLQG